jgi:antitoxin component of MazEF toxin-antitoxin module
MGPITITIHEPVPVPAELLSQLQVKPGDRLEWKVDGSELVLRRVRYLAKPSQFGSLWTCPL